MTAENEIIAFISKEDDNGLVREGFGNESKVPNLRVWEVVNKRDSNEGSVFRFKVMSYNVLAQCLLEKHRYLYNECVPQHLQWDKRASRMYDEIMNVTPDVICLQEVQESHLDEFFYKFEELGYSSVYKKRTGSERDGCAIYYKASVFQLQSYVTVEYHRPELPILNRNHVGIIVKLVPLNFPMLSLVVATTHLLFNPKRTDVRLAQLKLFLAEIDKLAYVKHKGKVPVYDPIILTGDFNATPNSRVIKLLDKGCIDFDDIYNWKSLGITDNCQYFTEYMHRQNRYNKNSFKVSSPSTEDDSTSSNIQIDTNSKEFKRLFCSGQLKHSLKLVSAYERLKANGQEEASTFQDEWVNVDYIYFDSCTLQLMERLRLPTVEECSAMGCLPNQVYGSDHLSLVASFEIKVKSNL